jgi:hypothetical protein
MYLISRLSFLITDRTVAARSLTKGVDLVGQVAVAELREAITKVFRIPWFEGKTWNWCVRVDYDQVPVSSPGEDNVNAFQWVTAFVAALYLVRPCRVLVGPSVVFRAAGDAEACYDVQRAFLVDDPPPARFTGDQILKAGELYEAICTMLRSGECARLIRAHRFFELTRRQAAVDVRCLLSWVSAETLLGGYGATARSGVPLRGANLLEAGGAGIVKARENLSALYCLRCKVAHGGGWPGPGEDDKRARQVLAEGEETVRQCLRAAIADGRWQNYRSRGELEGYFRDLGTNCRSTKADDPSDKAC